MGCKMHAQLQLLSALCLSLLKISTAGSVLYVKPSPLASCPAEPCHTLSEYAHNVSHYFTSNSTLVFLSGTHKLDTNLTVSGLTSLQLLGNTSEPTSCKVLCTKPASIHISDVTHIIVRALSVSFCGGEAEGILHIMAAHNFTLDSCQLLNSRNSRGLIVQATNFSHIRSCGFLNNTVVSATPLPGAAGAYINSSQVQITGNNEFVGNQGPLDAGGLMLYNCRVNFTGRAIFKTGKAFAGGGMTITKSVVNLNSRSLFVENSAGTGSALYIEQSSVLSIANTTIIEHNTAQGAGGGIFVGSHSKLLNFNEMSVNSNIALQGGGIYISQYSTLENVGQLDLQNNTATEIYGGGGILLTESSFACTGQLRAVGNTAATDGGALYVDFNSWIIVYPSTEMWFMNNTARQKGGAVYVNDAVSTALYCTSYGYFYKFMCFYQLEAEGSKQVHMTFDGNTAAIGDDLYGGMLGICKLRNSSQNSSEVFDGIANMRQNKTISSDAFQIRTCVGSASFDSDVFPGEMFNVRVMAVGQRNGMSQGIAQVNIESSSNTVSLGSYNQSRQHVGPNCTSLQLTVLTQETTTINLQVITDTCVGQSSTFNQTHALSIRLHIKPCPQPLFQLLDKHCGCSLRLNGFNATCNIGTQSITRPGTEDFWLGYDNTTDELILHPQCPFYYCVFETVSFLLNETDLQCSHNRSGLLCGACDDGLSLTLGLHMCSECSNVYLLLLVVFMVLGILLLVFLLIFKLTVAQGTINGLIFYANIFQMNKTIFFPHNNTGSGRFLPVFVSWLNLNFGFVTCFSNGMDMYVLTWLQYLFPLYILFLVVVLVSVRHYPSWITGTNPVAVLSTLILLSYNKILHTIVMSMSYTELNYKNHTALVWLYDGNIPYLEGKHLIMLAFAVIVLLVMVLPYTLLLLCGQCVISKSNWGIFCWVNNSKVKAFLDTYHGPYRVKHRYWPGLLLLLRVILLPPVAFSHNNDPSINLLAVSMVVIAVFTWVWMTGGIYKNRWLDVLEASILLNLGSLTAATYYCKVHDKSPTYISLASLGVLFLTFTAILAYHTLKYTRYGKKAMIKGRKAFGYIVKSYRRQYSVNSSEPLLCET